MFIEELTRFSGSTFNFVSLNLHYSATRKPTILISIYCGLLNRDLKLDIFLFQLSFAASGPLV